MRLTGATAKNLNSGTRVSEFKSQLYKPLTRRLTVSKLTGVKREHQSPRVVVKTK